MKNILFVKLVISLGTSAFADGPFDSDETKSAQEVKPFYKKPEVVLSTLGPAS